MASYRNNPIAPPWMWGGSHCSPDGSRDEYFQYVIRRTLAASQVLNDQPLLFEGDGCFLWRVAASRYNTGESAYIQLRDQLGRYTSNQPLLLNGWAGRGGEHTPLAVPEMIEPGAQWSYNLIETAAAAGGKAVFVFIGVKRRKG